MKACLQVRLMEAEIITGGLNGPQNSIQALIICLIVSVIILLIAKRKNKFIQPTWRT